MCYRLIAAMTIASVVATIGLPIANAQESDFFIGHIRADTIDYIMHYKNGTWKQPSGEIPPSSSPPMSLETYARTYWKSGPEVFATWYEINPLEPVAIRSKNVFVEHPGNCEGAVMVMRTDGGGKIGPGRAWVATKKGGLRWNTFETVGHIADNPDYRLFKFSWVAPIQKEYEPLVKQIKSRWLALEADVSPTPDLGANFKERLASAEYEEFLVERAALSNRQSLVFFLAAKRVRSVYAWYRGWALVGADGSVSWPYAVIALPGGRTVEQLFPEGILEVGEKQFLFSNVSAQYRTEKWIFEFANGKFNYQTNVLVEWCLPD